MVLSATKQGGAIVLTTGSDVQEITDVLYRYATGIDRRDWPLFRTCFAADCRLDYGDIGQWNGVEEVTDWMIDAHLAFGHTLHRITNPVVAIDGNTATARCYVHALLMPQAEETMSVEAFGYYDDELTKADGAWQIATRRFTMVRFLQSAG